MKRMFILFMILTIPAIGQEVKKVTQEEKIQLKDAQIIQLSLRLRQQELQKQQEMIAKEIDSATNTLKELVANLRKNYEAPEDTWGFNVNLDFEKVEAKKNELSGNQDRPAGSN